MFLYINKLGKIIEQITNRPIREGDNLNTIYLICEQTKDSNENNIASASIKFEFSDGYCSENISLDLVESTDINAIINSEIASRYNLKYFTAEKNYMEDANYIVFKYPFPNYYCINGTCKGSVIEYFSGNNDTFLSSGLFSFPIESSIVEFDTNYEYFVSFMENMATKIDWVNFDGEVNDYVKFVAKYKPLWEKTFNSNFNGYFSLVSFLDYVLEQIKGSTWKVDTEFNETSLRAIANSSVTKKINDITKNFSNELIKKQDTYIDNTNNPITINLLSSQLTEQALWIELEDKTLAPILYAHPKTAILQKFIYQIDGNTVDTTIFVLNAYYQDDISRGFEWNYGGYLDGSNFLFMQGNIYVNSIDDNTTIHISLVSNYNRTTNIVSNSPALITSGGVYTGLSLKQDTLVSGTNIKTINGNSMLGSGNLTISGSGSLYQHFLAIEISTVHYIYITIFNNSATALTQNDATQVFNAIKENMTGTYWRDDGNNSSTYAFYISDIVANTSFNINYGSTLNETITKDLVSDIVDNVVQLL